MFAETVTIAVYAWNNALIDETYIIRKNYDFFWALSCKEKQLSHRIMQTILYSIFVEPLLIVHLSLLFCKYLLKIDVLVKPNKLITTGMLFNLKEVIW